MKKLVIIFALLIIIYSITLIEPPIKNINETNIGDYVKVQGIIEEIFKPPRITIMNLTDNTGSIKVVFFNEVTAWKGMNAEITGRVADYKGEKELKGVRIKLLN